MKILWVSNAAFVGTGYGVGTDQVVRLLQADGHEVTVLSYYGLQGADLVIDGIRHLSPRSDQWANDIIADYFDFVKADIVLIHRDIWVNNQEVSARIPTAVWFPIDSAPLAPLIKEHMARPRWLATMSQWATDIARAEGFDVTYLPHGVDTDIFQYARRPEMREAYFHQSLPDINEDSFLILIVAANKGFPSRKGFPEMFRAAGEFMRRHEDAFIHIHSLATSEHSGPDLVKLADACDVPKTRMSILNPFMFHHGVEPAMLAEFYQTADVLLNTSYGEGFGIPIIEAQACGTPVITTAFSSMPELTFNGFAVDGRDMMNALYSYWKVPDWEEILQSLEVMYADRRRFTDKALATSQFVRREFAAETVYDRYWRPFIAKIAADLESGRAGDVPL